MPRCLKNVASQGKKNDKTLNKKFWLTFQSKISSRKDDTTRNDLCLCL